MNLEPMLISYRQKILNNQLLVGQVMCDRTLISQIVNRTAQILVLMNRLPGWGE